MTDNDDFIPPQLPTVDPEDVAQEAALLRLLGITPNKRILRHRLQPRELVYFTAPEDAIPVGLLVPTPIPPAHVTEALLDWTLDQDDETQLQLWNFLEDPELHLEHTLKLLRDKHLLADTTATAPQEVSLASIIRHNLPSTAAQLADLIRQLSPTTERPEATIRQWIRRNLKAGRIEIVDEVISLKES